MLLSYTHHLWMVVKVLSHLFCVCCLLSPFDRMSRPWTQSSHRDVQISLVDSGSIQREPFHTQMTKVQCLFVCICVCSYTFLKIPCFGYDHYFLTYHKSLKGTCVFMKIGNRALRHTQLQSEAIYLLTVFYCCLLWRPVTEIWCLLLVLFCTALFCIYYLILYSCTEWDTGVCNWCRWMLFFERVIYFTDIKVLGLEGDSGRKITSSIACLYYCLV